MDNVKILLETELPKNAEVLKLENGKCKLRVSLPTNMDQLVRENLKRYSKETKTSIVSIAESLDITPPTLYKFKKGESSMSLDRVDELNKLMQEKGYFIYL